MKKCFLTFISIIILVLIFICCKENEAKTINKPTSTIINTAEPQLDSIKLKSKAKEALTFCTQENFNTEFCILIDMSIHSGKKRFFVLDFKLNKITHQYLVGHGCGESLWGVDGTKDNPTFSNENDSHLSALGKYKLGQRGYSNWGVHTKYLMHGLDKTNDNALKRIIVFHSWEMMSDEEVYPKGSPEGWGCPTLSNKSFLEIDPLIKNSAKPVLMWIYN